MDLVCGRIVKPHGVRGEIVVELRTDFVSERFAVGNTLTGHLRKVQTDYVVEAARMHSGRLLLRLEGVNSRDAVDELRGTLLCVDSESISDLQDDDEFHDHQLIGLTAYLSDYFSQDGGLSENAPIFGEVTDVLHISASELLEIKPADGQASVLIPFLRAMVPVVDVTAGHVVIDPPEGLLDL